MESANKQGDLFKRENKFCLECDMPFWGWPSDAKCMNCWSDVEEATSINITHTRQQREKLTDG